MEIWYPKAQRLPQSGDGGEMRGGHPRGVLHTTETTNWAGANWYHIEYKPGFGFRQYRPFDRAARGLLHPTSTPDTNRQGSVCVQIAVTDYARNAQKWTDETVADVAEFIAWCNAEFGIGAWSRADVGWGGEAYGPDSVARMLWDEWAEFDGWCGHQEVPANAHWDAGRVDWIRLLEADVAQFTEDEASELRKLLGALEAMGSSVYFVEPSVKIARVLKEDEPDLGIKALVGATSSEDEVARTAIAALADKLNGVVEALRSV